MALMDGRRLETAAHHPVRARRTGDVRQAERLFRQVTDRTAPDIAEDAGVELKVTVPPDLTVRADRDRLRQALANLVDNAIKYTPRGGRVDVSAHRDDGAVVIRVADTGRGIPERDLPRIFDRLYRGDESRTTRGLGLGLSLVRAYVEAQGGAITVESTSAKGSRFEIRLPS
jgi:signal transduction histidine kinase